MEQLEMHNLLCSFCFEVPAPLKPFWLVPKAVTNCSCRIWAQLSWEGTGGFAASSCLPSAPQLSYDGGLCASDRGHTFGFWMSSGRSTIKHHWHNTVCVWRKAFFQGSPLFSNQLFYLAWLVGQGVGDLIHLTAESAKAINNLGLFCLAHLILC